jgi:hypothetical protein
MKRHELINNKDIRIIGQVYSMKCEVCGGGTVVNYCRLTDKTDGKMSYSDICEGCLTYN